MRRKERGRQLLRILKLIKLFEHSRYGMTINELCREMTVTRRTLYRDLDMVEDAGYRFVKEGGGGGFSKKWRFPPGMRKAPDKPYTESELLSLYFCMNLLQPFRGRRSATAWSRCSPRSRRPSRRRNASTSATSSSPTLRR